MKMSFPFKELGENEKLILSFCMVVNWAMSLETRPMAAL